MKKAIQFGAGNIGRGFIGGLLSKAGYHVVFADVNQEIIDKINEDKKYTIFVKDVESSEIVITDISGVNSTKPELIDEVKEAEIITNLAKPLDAIIDYFIKSFFCRFLISIKYCTYSIYLL